MLSCDATALSRTVDRKGGGVGGGPVGVGGCQGRKPVSKWMPGGASGRIRPTTFLVLVDLFSDHKQRTTRRVLRTQRSLQVSL